MADSIYPRRSAVIYESVFDSIRDLESQPELQRKFMYSYMDYVFHGTYRYNDDPIVNSLMKQPMILSDQSATRYDKAKADGAAGGAITKGKRERWTNEEVYQYYKVEGHKLEDAVEHFGYSKRTIQDKCKKYIESTQNMVAAEVTKIADEPVVPEKVDGEWKF